VRIFSGIQPTGRKHLGNYIGAIVQYVASQDRGEGIFCIVDLQDPTKKMSTTGASEQGTVFVLEEPQAIERKLRSAVTDSGSDVRRAPQKPGISNLIEILAAVRGVEPPRVEAEFAQAGYGEFKSAVAAAVVDYLTPVRERYEQLRGEEAGLERILQGGAERARAMASETLADVRERMGVGAPRQGRPLP